MLKMVCDFLNDRGFMCTWPIDGRLCVWYEHGSSNIALVGECLIISGDMWLANGRRLLVTHEGRSIRLSDPDCLESLMSYLETIKNRMAVRDGNDYLDLITAKNSAEHRLLDSE